MKQSQFNRSQFIVGIALFIVGIALVAAAVLVVLLADYAAAGAAAMGVPGLGLIAASRLVLVATPRRR